MAFVGLLFIVIVFSVVVVVAVRLLLCDVSLLAIIVSNINENLLW